MGNFIMCDSAFMSKSNKLLARADSGLPNGIIIAEFDGFTRSADAGALGISAIVGGGEIGIGSGI